MAGAVPLTGEPTPINQGRLMMYTWQGQWTQAKDPLSGYPGSRRWTWIMVCRSNGDASPAVAIGVVMCAIGGTSLPQWMPEYAVNTAYGNMLAQARKARAKRLKASCGTKVNQIVETATTSLPTLKGCTRSSALSVRISAFRICR